MPLLVLASRSPRRLTLLRQIGLEPIVTPVDVDEAHVHGEDPIRYARRVAVAKVQAAARVETREAIILAADTTVWLGENDAPMGKPADRAQAAAMLRRLMEAGMHHVTTAWATVDTRRQSRATVHPLVEHETTKVWMRELDEERLEAYLDHEQWTDKAGGYAVQESAAAFVTRVEGSYTNVVGLPVAQVCVALERFGLR